MKQIWSLKNLDELVNNLRKLPYLASKNVYRVAFALLKQSEEDNKKLLEVITNARKSLMLCKTCLGWSEQEFCLICADPARSKLCVCIVSSWQQMVMIERAASFAGTYHVLGGLLSPINGIGPEDLSIQHLLKRVEADNISELIFAVNPTPEGEATSSFIASQINPNLKIKFTRLASGLPVGSNIEFMDRVTISKALDMRQDLDS